MPPLFRARLAALIRAHDILRVKGFLDVPGSDRRQVVQAVGDRLEQHFDRPWRPGEARASRLVVIGRKGLDRAAIRAAAGGGVLKCICSPPSPERSPTGRRGRSRPDAGRHRRAGGADSEIACWPRRRRGGGPKRRRRRACGSRLLQLGHNFSVDLYVETGRRGAAGRSCACSAAAPTGPTASSGWSRPAGRMAFRWRSCPATTSPMPSWRGSRPCRPRPAAGCGAISPKAASAMPTNFLRYAASLIGRPADGASRAPLLRAGLYWPGRARCRALTMIAAELAERRRRRSCRSSSIGRWCKRATRRRSMRWSRRCVRAGCGRCRSLSTASRSRKPPRCWRRRLPRHPPDVILNATGFAVAAPGGARPAAGRLSGAADRLLGRRRGILARRHPRAGAARPRDERGAARDRRPHPRARRLLQGAIAARDLATEADLVGYRPVADRIAFVADLARNWARLRRRRRPSGASRSCSPTTRTATAASATASGSTRRNRRSRCCARCGAAGYRVGDLPDDAGALMERLLAGPTNARPHAARPRRPCRSPTIRFSSPSLPASVQQRVDGAGARPSAIRSSARAGLDCGHFAIPGLWLRQCRGADPAGARLQHRPGGDLSRPGPGAAARLPRFLCLARRQLPRRRGRPPRQARQPRMAARQGAGAVGGMLPRGGAGAAAASLSRSSSTIPARAPRPSGARRRSSSTT